MSRTEIKAFKTRYDLKESVTGYVFVLPILLFISFFVLVPVAGTFITSLFRQVAFMPSKFTFLENFKNLFSDRAFYRAAWFTLLFTAVSVPLEIVLGFVVAWVLNADIPFRGILRASVLIPWAIPAAISARVFQLIYNYNFGLANAIALKLNLVSEPVNWLGTSFGAFCAVVAADVWKTTPFAAIIILAGLQSIPSSLYEQARIDGASSTVILGRIILPMLKPVLTVALLFRTIDAIRVFDVIYVLTGGGPGGATTSLSHYAYKFYLSSDFGYGSAVSVVLFVFALCLSIIYMRKGGFSRDIL